MNKLMHGIVLAVFGLACWFVWVRKKEQCPSWVAFLATTMSTVVLLMLPTFLALYLPIISLLVRLPHDRWRAHTRPLSPHENTPPHRPHRG